MESRNLSGRDILYSTPGQERDEILEAGCSRVTAREETETWTKLETVHNVHIIIKDADYRHPFKHLFVKNT
jgi:hypothetical protein